MGASAICRGSNILHKQLEMRLVFQLGPCSRMALTLISSTYELCERHFLRANILRILTVIFHTEEGLYIRNVCGKRQF